MDAVEGEEVEVEKVEVEKATKKTRKIKQSKNANANIDRL